MRSGAALLLRWMLFVIIALDLASSPLHAHHHDGGPEGYGHQAAAVDFAGTQVAEELHLASGAFALADVDDASRGGHSVSALRYSSVQVEAPESQEASIDAPFPALWLALLGETEPVEGQDLGLRPARERCHIPSFRTVPPDGRAPPLTHV